MTYIMIWGQKKFLTPRSKNIDAQNARKGYMNPFFTVLSIHIFLPGGQKKVLPPDYYIGHWGTPHIKSKKNW